MFDIGWQELLLIGVVALVFVGPKDLPKALRSGARILNKARAMSREFQSGLAEMAREAELDEIRRKVRSATDLDLGEELKKSVDPSGNLSADFDPAEFNRKLKESVEGGPPSRPASPPEPTRRVPQQGSQPEPEPEPHQGPQPGPQAQPLATPESGTEIATPSPAPAAEAAPAEPPAAELSAAVPPPRKPPGTFAMQPRPPSASE